MHQPRRKRRSLPAPPAHPAHPQVVTVLQQNMPVPDFEVIHCCCTHDMTRDMSAVGQAAVEAVAWSIEWRHTLPVLNPCFCFGPWCAMTISVLPSVHPALAAGPVLHRLVFRGLVRRGRCRMSIGGGLRGWHG